MPNAPSYNRTVDFTDRTGDETDHSSLNAEFDNVSNSFNKVNENLQKIQKDDGTLKNGVVTADSLAPSAFESVANRVAAAETNIENAANSAASSLTAANAAKDAAVAAKTSAELSRDAARQHAENAAAKLALTTTAANNAATKAIEAAGSASETEALLNAFQSTFLGIFASDTDANNFATSKGFTLIVGMMYKNSTIGKLRIYKSAGWGDYDASAQQSQSEAALSASTATAKATAAANSATAAANSATAAANNADNAGVYFSTIAGLSTNATNSASTATAKAREAAASAASAAASATAAADAVSSGVSDGSVTTAKLADSAVTSAKIATVEASKLIGKINAINATTGSVIQVVSSQTNSSIETSSLNWVNTNLSVSITPQFNTSRILIIVADTTRSQGAPNYHEQWSEYGIFRDGISTALKQVMTGWGSSPTTFGKVAYGNVSTSYLDSPSTTSQITYRTKMRCDIVGGSQSMAAHMYSSYYGGNIEGVSQIIAMEIAG